MMSEHAREVLGNVATIVAVCSAGIVLIGRAMPSLAVAIIGTAALGVAGVAIAIGIALKDRKAVYGTESRRRRSISELALPVGAAGQIRPSGRTSAAIFGTESNQIEDPSELTPIEG